MHDKHQIGTIAQDLENNFAEVVNTDSDGMKSVDYCMLGVVAIEGIKLLKQEVEDLKKAQQLTDRVVLRGRCNGAKPVTEAADAHFMCVVGERSVSL